MCSNGRVTGSACGGQQPANGRASHMFFARLSIFAALR